MAIINESSDSAKTTSLIQRLLAVFSYLGGAPLLILSRRCRNNEFIRHHWKQALILSFFLFGSCLHTALKLSVETVWIMHDAEHFHFHYLPILWDWLESLINFHLFLLWALFSLAGIVLAVTGSKRAIFLVTRIAQRNTVVRFSLAIWGFLYVFTMATGCMAWHATTLPQHEPVPAKAYMLYDDMEFFPRWIFDLGFYRISLASRKHWGSDSTAVLPLNEENLKLALRHGQFVFLACHGDYGYIFIRTPKDEDYYGVGYGPDEIMPEDLNQNLDFVYITACYGGMLADEWESALAPAQVVTFSRFSYQAEHALWLWIEGPETINEIGAKNNK